MWRVWQTWKMGRRAAGFLGGLLVALLLAAGPAAGQTFSSQMTLSNGVGDATSPVVATGVTTSGQVQVYFAWKEGNDIWLKRALVSAGSCGRPGTLEFGAAQNLSNVNPNQVSASRPATAANGRGGVFVAWLEVPTSGGQYIRLWRSVEGSAPSLQSLGFNGVSPNNPAVAADNNNGVFVAADGTGPAGRTYVWLAQPLDSGATSFTYLNVTAKRLASARRPSIASDGSKVHVVWRETGVWYRGFDRGSTQAQLDDPILFPTSPLTAPTAPAVQFPPKVAVHGGEVTAAWFEGTNPLAPTDLKAVTTTGGIFPAPGSAVTIHSSPLRHSNLSLSVGPAGRLFGWQEADTATSASSNHYLLQAAPARPFDSGSSFEALPSFPTAGPSVGLDGTGRVVAAWRENVSTTTDVKLGYDGGSAGGEAPVLQVRHAPQTLQAKTMDQGSGVFNFWISGVQGELDLSTLTVNGNPNIRPIRIAVDANGDLQLTFSRSALKAAFVGNDLTAAQLNGSYTIAGSTKNPSGCFSASDQVQIIR